MQSNKHKRFSRMSTGVFAAVTVIVVVWLLKTISGSVQMPSLHQPPTPTQATSTTSTTATAPIVAGIPAQPTIKLLRAPKGSIRVELANTDASRERGLSGRTGLAKDSGMLFTFPNAGVYGFWMKDMQFSLDMVWIGADQKVSGIAPGVSPESFPEIFYPPSDILHVLELPAGSAASYGIATGTQLQF